VSSTYLVDDSDLVQSARSGDDVAWTQLVERFQPLVTKIARRHRLDAADADDVRQLVWTRLVEHIDDLRDPRALAGWISTTASRACLEVIRQRKRSVSVDPTEPAAFDKNEPAVGWRLSPSREPEVDDRLVRIERRRALRESLAALTDRQQQLLLLLVADPPVPYGQISQQMGMPVGSIGPTRARLLKRLGECVAIRRLDDRYADAELAAA
jgi:RNA polymerase sigma factor (sigma-70 family)